MQQPRILLLTPPLTQLNTPYPAICYLKSFLNDKGYQNVDLLDVSIEWVQKLLSQDSLTKFYQVLKTKKQIHPHVVHFLNHFETIKTQISTALSILQNKRTGLEHRIYRREYFTEGIRFKNIGPKHKQDEFLQWNFGILGISDQCKYFATLFVEEIFDVIHDGIDPHFQMSKYGESLAASIPTLDPLLNELKSVHLTTDILDEMVAQYVNQFSPDIVGMSIPFPGNVLGALRLSQTFKRLCKNIKIIWGGGYINTELRHMNDDRIFNFIDAVTYDDGEWPLLHLIEYFTGVRKKSTLIRSQLRNTPLSAKQTTESFKELSCPTYKGLNLDRYLSIVDMLNPMHRLWSDSHWNKLIIAHGCYWKKCTFCDVSLDYIGRYEPLKASTIADRMERLIDETNYRGFHFVDEAAPPSVLKSLAQEIITRKLTVSWWGNIRFEKTFDRSLCELLKESGCIALTGGLEVASNRLLKLIQKGVTVEQVARVTKAMNEAKIMVHAYLMYGFPTQTEQEIIDSLDLVRQLFKNGCLDSAYWHRFALTIHSPIAKKPKQFGLEILSDIKNHSFAYNDLDFKDNIGCDPTPFTQGLNKAVYNYMSGMGLDDDVRIWFKENVPKSSVAKNLIQKALQ